VVPFSVLSHGNSYIYGKNHNTALKENPLHYNTVLVEFLRNSIKKGKYEILLHGITHEYQRIGSKLVPEMLWKDKDTLMSGIREGKSYLESVLHCNIKTFVAPSNKINQKGICAIEKIGLNFSGIIYNCDRRLNNKYLINYFKRWSFRLFKGYPYPGLLDYGSHKEINACRLESFSYLWKLYQLCKNSKLPMVINTHYWHLNKNKDVRTIFWQFIHRALTDGAEPVLLERCIE